ncbi:hypothetical protein [Microvirga massiliensis]|uniref:hypothetical protein n=1 Tax=Microvirga massiliensis TaxID=1033741 RepID=UPI000A91F673|nr:hypothetical protein [Microvirga massiliensis]
MDVLVTPSPGPRKAWDLTDRLGRKVGQIISSAEDEFIITAAETRLDAPLSKAQRIQPSLDAAMDEIAKCLRGVCQFSRKEDR